MKNTAEFLGFERIYSTDLVYTPGCWKLCGDAHCCSFARYKARFRVIARSPFQELLLLPGEYEYLSKKGWLEQFGDFDHKVIDFPIDGFVLKVESIISRKPNCACDHDTRPTICRLYPLLPVFDVGGRLVGTEPLGIYEEMERVEGMEPACKLTALPFDEIGKFLDIAAELGKCPRHLYYLEAYRLTKKHVSVQLAERRAASDSDVFSLFETAFIRRKLVDGDQVRAQLNDLMSRFRSYYGASFEL